jgi:UDP-glucose 4-epimerase
MEGKRVLITGGAGFIGSNLAHHLSQRNEVVVIDDLSTGKMANLAGFKGQFIKEDIRKLAKLPEGIDYVFHLAAYISVPGSVLEPEKNDDINIAGTEKVLAASRNAGVKKLIFASSAAVYGDVPEKELPVTEDLALRPASPYAGSKMTAEDYCLAYNDMFGLGATVLRMFNVYGPRQDPGSQYAAVVPAFVNKVMKGQRPVIYGDGGQTRDFVFVGDVARAFELAAENKGSDGQVINIASGKGTSIKALASEVARAAGKRLEPIFKPPRPGDVRHSVASVAKAKEVLGWDARIPLSKGLGTVLAHLAKATGKRSGTKRGRPPSKKGSRARSPRTKR